MDKGWRCFAIGANTFLLKIDLMNRIQIELPTLKSAGKSYADGRIHVPEFAIPARTVEVDLDLVEALIAAAREVAERAYAPYSKFRVGSAVKMAGTDQIFTGCNVENAAYGDTICAERNAIQSAVAAGFRKIEIVALSTIDSLGGELGDRSPCGACRQVISEFSGEETLVAVDGSDGVSLLDVERVLPFGFFL